MKSFAEQVEEIRQAIEIRLENFGEAVEKYHSERARLREKYFSEGFRADIAEQRADEETAKIKHKIEAINKELSRMVMILENIDLAKIRDEQARISKKHQEKTSGVDKRERGVGVLIVEDAALMREVIRNVLSKSKIAIAGEAENGKVAVEKYKELMPELVIMDIDMPDMDGLEALKLIKEFDPDAKVVMCSQVSKQSTVDDSIRLGALNFIAKPFKAERVLEIVKNALGK